MADGNARPAIFKSLTHEVLAVISISAAPAMSAVGLGGVQISLPQIGASFGIEGSDLTWLLSSYTLTAGSFLLLFGTLSDIYGRKKILLASYAWFSVWCLISGFMKNHIVFDVMRGLQGIGGAACIPAGVGILGACYPEGQRRNKVFSYFSAGNPIGFVVGIIAGGICSQFIGWRSNMWFLAILYTIMFILAYFTVPSDSETMSHLSPGAKRNRKVDYFGAALITIGFGIIVFAISQAESAPKGWGTSYIIAFLVVGVSLLFGFVGWEAYVKDPLMPLKIWKQKNFAAMMAIVFLAQMAFPSVLQFYAVLWFQKVRDVGPLLTAGYFVPMAAGGLVVNIVAGLTMHIIPGRVFLVVGMLAFTGASLLWALQPMYLAYWKMSLWSLLLSVVGIDLVYMVANLFVIQTATGDMQSTAGGVLNTIIQLGTSVGLGASSAIATRWSDHDESKEGLVRGYRAAFWFAVIATVLGAIFSVFLKIGRQGHVKDSGASTSTSDGETVSNSTDTLEQTLTLNAEKSRTGDNQV